MELPIDIHSTTPLVDALQLARGGYVFTDEEWARIQELGNAQARRRQRERRNIIREMTDRDNAGLESKIDNLTELLEELPYMGQEQQPATQPRQTPSRPAQPRYQSPNPSASIPRNSKTD